MNTLTRSLLRWTRFSSNPHGTGPEKRSAQIRAICAAAGYETRDMQSPETAPRLASWSSGIRARLQHGRYASVDRAGIGLLGYRDCFYRDALRSHPGARLLLWETTYDTLLPHLAKAAGFRVIALPHNLEALVSEQAFAGDKDVDRDLAAEIARLKLADAVFTISKEEQWFLEARGVRADYLPFYPNPLLVAECEQIRARRLARVGTGSSEEAPLLLLGSAFNPATARGMSQQLAWLGAAPQFNRSIVVAGAATEKLPATTAKTILRGSVSRAELIELLASCSALLVHTEGGAGAVTRIPEALLAGIPVIANVNAARDQHGVPGVHVYHDVEEFLHLAHQALPPPPPPPKPVAAEKRLQDAVRRLNSESTPHG